ncbi:hypothetical protein QYE76_040696 [Lolium multiflorum]|uniref:Uncharacterized protein n=1 Tax=Lolium multiflorum TaxID=4521 RepID=A0AAD8WVP6_LOLMU|nr:hypothetical protein QYE76_040696 [Lolium multiflorum]
MSRSSFLIICMPRECVLFQPNTGVSNTTTGLDYNMFYAQVVSMYVAIQALGQSEVDVKTSKTVWSSKGNPRATVEAGDANRHLRVIVVQREPQSRLAFERNYGLFHPNGTLVYNVGRKKRNQRRGQKRNWMTM